MAPPELLNVNGRQLILARTLVKQRADLLTNEETCAALFTNPRLFISFLNRNEYEYVCNGRISARLTTNASIYIYLDTIETIKGRAIIPHDKQKRQQSESSGRRKKKAKPTPDVILVPEQLSSPGYQTIAFDDVSIVLRLSDGYVNASKICQAGGREIDDYRNDKGDFIDRLSGTTNLPRFRLIEESLTGPDENKGIFVHPRIAISLAQWIGPTFAREFVYMGLRIHRDLEESVENTAENPPGDQAADVIPSAIDEEPENVPINVSQSVDADPEPIATPADETTNPAESLHGEHDEALIDGIDGDDNSTYSDDTISENETDTTPLENCRTLFFDHLSIQFRNSDGYVNATKLCKDGGKRWKKYHENKTTAAFLEELSRSLGIPRDLLVDQIRTGRNENRRTFVHPHIAINLAQRISPKFAVAVSTLVIRYSQGHVTTEESQQFAQMLDNNVTASDDADTSCRLTKEKDSHIVDGLYERLKLTEQVYEGQLKLHEAKNSFLEAQALKDLRLVQSEMELQKTKTQSEMELQKTRAQIEVELQQAKAQIELEISASKHKLEIQDLKFQLEAARVKYEYATENQRLRALYNA